MVYSWKCLLSLQGQLIWCSWRDLIRWFNDYGAQCLPNKQAQRYPDSSLSRDKLTRLVRQANLDAVLTIESRGLIPLLPLAELGAVSTYLDCSLSRDTLMRLVRQASLDTFLVAKSRGQISLFPLAGLGVFTRSGTLQFLAWCIDEVL
jgi:hypothetical protein